MDDLVPLLLRHGPLLVFVVTLAARAGAPLPAAPLLVVAGGLGALGQMPLGVTIGLSLLANLLGDVVWFVAGRVLGYRVLRLLCRISLSPDSCVRQSEDLFGRWGGLSLVAAKFVPGVSVIAAPMAGALRMTWTGFLAWNVVAAATWTAVYMGLGALFRFEITRALAVLADAGVKALFVIAALVVLAAALRWARRRRGASFAAHVLVTAQELADEVAKGEPVLFLDVRGRVAREAAGTVPRSVVAELGRMEQAVRGIAKSTPIVTYCDCPNEVSAVKAAGALQALGFENVRVLVGGFDAWKRLDHVAGELTDAAERPVGDAYFER
jgi:membrane protein DedA with SNARE-associated domain/rhodanese-related sulfurtransferase